jgi:dTDP-4-amino-4,6-dideoxy-D-galactose acyltransferase
MNMPAPTATTFRFLDWDSAHFGLRIGQVTEGRFDEPLAREAADWANFSAIDCMYLRLDEGDAASIRHAGNSGWRFVDTRVTLRAELREAVRGSADLREARDEDIPYLKQLARRSHTKSRFYADGNFPQRACDELYAAWIERSVLDREFAGAVLVPLIEGDQPAGYITCAMQDGAGVIGLIAIDEKARGQGLGQSLLKESSHWFQAQGARTVSVVTQGSNIPALRMYARHQFAIESVELWFHWWRKNQ